jgi:hypothetical protein
MFSMGLLQEMAASVSVNLVYSGHSFNVYYSAKQICVESAAWEPWELSKITRVLIPWEEENFTFVVCLVSTWELKFH